jgi:hypothetical protein
VTPDLDQVLADARQEVVILRSNGNKLQAKTLERFADRVAASMVDYLTWLPEDRATLYSGLKAPALRSRFPSLELRGLAKWDEGGRRRLYRRQALEHRGNAEAAREAGRRAAGEGSAA